MSESEIKRIKWGLNTANGVGKRKRKHTFSLFSKTMVKLKIWSRLSNFSTLTKWIAENK